MSAARYVVIAAAAAAPAPLQRHTRNFTCPVCGGWDNAPRGRGVRCYGFSAGRSAFCTREEHAGGAPWHDGSGTYRHWLAGPCPCGHQHGDAAAVPVPVIQPAATQAPALEPGALSLVFERLLEVLELRPAHRDYLLSRGPADLAVAEALGYRSLPFGYTAARRVVDGLVADFGAETLAKVPGFYRRGDRLAMHTATADKGHFLIPARDAAGHITGLIRRYVGSDPDEAKYKTVTGGGADFHTLAGPDWPAGTYRALVVVEGVHKAHVTAHLSGWRVMGLPGTTLRPAHVDAILALRPDVVRLALDADRFHNRAVAKAEDAAIDKLQAAGLRVEVLVWEQADGKGLDDLLAAGQQPRRRVVPIRPTLGPRAPYPTRTPAAVPPGRPMAEVEAETGRSIRDFIGHPRANAGRALLVVAPPGVGKTHTAATAVVQERRSARILVATRAKAAELADAFGVTAVQGRNADNCSNFPVVEAARAKGFDVARVVCQQCPDRPACRSEAGRYYAQFRTAGTLVGPVEMLGSASFFEHGEMVIADDADLGRALVDVRDLRAADALQIAALVPPGPQRELLTVVQKAIDAPDLLTEDGRRPGVLVGPPAWDALARAAGSAAQLAALVDAVPAAEDLLPGADADGGPLTVEAIEAAPPAVLAALVEVLKDELPAFRRGDPFNSGLTLRDDRLRLRRLRPLPVSRTTGKPLLHERALLILDATPLPPLVDALTDGMERLPDYAPVVALPPNVAVMQVADAFAGKTSITRTVQTGDGAARRPGRDRLLASLRAARADFPGDREAVLCAKALRDDVLAEGLPAERVLTFGGSRGLNSIEDADVLHVLGRPQMPDTEALQLAHVLYKAGPPVEPHLALVPAGYAGYAAADGSGRAVDVLDFADPRVSAIFRQSREAELVQGVHRARLFRVADAQGDLFEPDGAALARTAARRRAVRVILHTAQPVPGLRVSDLLYTPAAGAAVNEDRQAAAAGRIAAAAVALAAEGAAVTLSAVAARAGADKRTASAYAKSARGSGHPYRERSIKGIHHPLQNSCPLPSEKDVQPPPPAPRPAPPPLPPPVRFTVEEYIADDGSRRVRGAIT